MRDAEADRSEGAGILDLVHDGVIVRDLAGTIVEWNAAAAHQYGWTRAEAVGRKQAELLPHMRGESFEALDAGLEAAGSWEGEVTRRARDGRERVVELRWSLRASAAGSAGRIVETGRDVTDRRATEAALRLNDYRFRNLFEAMAVSFWEIDFNRVGALLLPLRGAGVADLRAYLADHPELVREAMRVARVLDVNARTLSLFGAASKDEIVGDGVERFWPEASVPLFVEALAATLEKQPHLISETRLLDLQGREIEALFTVSWSAESRKQGVVLLGVIDIGDRLRAERMLRKVQADLAHAARVATLGEFTASIAHEVNQPLAAISANAGAGLRWLERPEPDLDEVGAVLARIAADSRRAADIIQRVRTMAQRREPERAELCVNALVEETIAFLRHDLDSHRVAVALSLAGGLPPVHADRVQIQQVLVNLAVNAMQAMAGYDETAARLDIATEAGPQAVRILFEDKGPGFGGAVPERLFDGFFTTKASGMGMGLPICRSIIEAHGGHIEAGDRPDGPGARFVVTLPVLA
ncbi:PAS domain-containing sensor histidine kinase [Sphingosinicella terrae]|uniref:PAS domain-containing sensor histidine kinase n=1 Tax=Sphingosinicella terrae TaxID=2172047 RepID=UPI0013B39434|nr:PAS domain S-box protein [Sphingosinicella terrae]